MARLVCNLDIEGGGVATNQTGHEADAAACVNVHVGHVSCADELVVHEHPGAWSALRLLGDLFLCHLNHTVAGFVCDFYFKCIVHGFHL